MCDEFNKDYLIVCSLHPEQSPGDSLVTYVTLKIEVFGWDIKVYNHEGVLSVSFKGKI